MKGFLNQDDKKIVRKEPKHDSMHGNTEKKNLTPLVDASVIWTLQHPKND